MTFVLALTAALLVTQPDAPAAEPASRSDEAAILARARERFAAGQKFFKQARYAEALARFEETWALRPHPSIRFNIGKCHEQLGDAPRALRAYRDYLRLDEGAADRAEVYEAIARLERRIHEQGLQLLDVTADKPGAQVSIDGAELGAAPASAALPVGVHRVTVKLEGFEPFEKVVALQLSQAAEVDAVLRPLGDAPRLTQAPVLMPPRPPTPSLEVAAAPPRQRVWTYVAGGAAIAGTGVALGLLVGAQGNARALGTADVTRTQREADALYGGYGTMMTGSHIAWAVAGTAAATALVLLVLEK